MIDLVISGAGSHVIDEAAAAFAIREKRIPARLLGTSAGGLVTLALAFDVPALRLRDVFDHWLVGNRLIDGSVFNLVQRYGWARGNALREAAADLIGEHTELGEARIPVGCVVFDYYMTQPRTVSSWENPKVLACDLAVATAAIPGAFGMQTIRGLGVGNRLHGDGGSAKNFAMDEFDDVPDRPTVGIRCKQPKLGEAVPIRGIPDACRAIAAGFMWASDNAHMSRKQDALIVDVPTNGSGLDFDLTLAERRARWDRGWAAGELANLP